MSNVVESAAKRRGRPPRAVETIIEASANPVTETVHVSEAPGVDRPNLRPVTVSYTHLTLPTNREV